MQVVAPGVIRAGEKTRGRSPRLRCAYARATVAANIHQRLDLTILRPDDNAGLHAEIDDEIVAGARHAAGMPDAKPMPQQDAVHVEFENASIGIELALERMPRRMATDESRHIEGHVQVGRFDVGSAH